MLKSLELLKNGYRGLTSVLSAEQSSSHESKQAQSELKSDILQRVKEVTNEIPQQPIILSVVTQALASTTEDDLLKMMVTVRDELSRLIMKHQVRDFLEMELPENVSPVHKIEGSVLVENILFEKW